MILYVGWGQRVGHIAAGTYWWELVITFGVTIAEFYDYLVDINGHKFEPWQAIAIICGGGMVITFMIGLFLAWLFRLTDSSPHPHLD